MTKVFLMYSYYGTTFTVKQMNNEQHAKNYGNKLKGVRYRIITTTPENQQQDLENAEKAMRRNFILYPNYTKF